MNNRERVMAILNYEKYDKVPVAHFGYWDETYEKWQKEGFLTEEEAKGPEKERLTSNKLGFDFGWGEFQLVRYGLYPPFEEKVIEEFSDGSKKIQNSDGVIVLQMPDATSIPAEFDHVLKDRKSWEEHFLPRLQFKESRIDKKKISKLKEKGRPYDEPLGIFCGSMIGGIRNWLGVEGISYLSFDDEKLYDEIINTCADLSYKCLETVLASGIKFDFGHFWEDICFKNGPLVVPSVFDEKCGPHYKRVTNLLSKYGVKIVSLDCDGCIDALIPTWFKNGVNTMFPIEVGTWNANIKPWREQYGPELRGIGGMNKTVFARDFAAIDKEVERLKPLVALGGYIPCPDHRIPPDAKWDNVKYYCDKMREKF